MSTLFYLSLGLRAPHGLFYPNGSFVRPVAEGVLIGGENSFITTHFSPLLVSSIAYSFFPVFCYVLLAYHFAASWLRGLSNHPNSLPTPSQYHHSLDLVADISFTSLYNLLTYTTRQLRKKTTSPANSSPILKTAAFGAIIFLSITWAIRVINVVLHEQIHPPSYLFIIQILSIQAECQSSTTDNCAVINGTQTGNLGALNQSSIFRVYKYGSSVPLKTKALPSSVPPASQTATTSHIPPIPTPSLPNVRYGQGIGSHPFILCSILTCNTTVYDAEYTLSDGTFSLSNSSFTPSNASAAIAMSSRGHVSGHGRHPVLPIWLALPRRPDTARPPPPETPKAIQPPNSPLPGHKPSRINISAGLREPS
ncbi:hypothetical protein BT96DRAFT_1005154 [Gymnopus androsaceus JB14]|uniref:Uncharacterized protein n=1 Tax=Gymnopus androsaceus JB14 TaxID=1447944 RepID=A0A6A4GPW8_9AGAR|nr:hypothetical protein BT96DRAFT_1005154 [Gymnopus androsaceus JB14]